MKQPTHIPTKLFGPDCQPAEATILLLPVPCTATTPGRSGTALGPESMLSASDELGSRTPQEHAMLHQLKVAALPIHHDHAHQLKESVKAKALHHLRAGKVVGVLGGDHSAPLGLIEALAEPHNNFGILHIGAHPGLCKAPEGFTYSHTALMHNVLLMPHITKLVQVGLRSCTAQELEQITAEEGRIFPFFDHDLKQQRFQGTPWQQTCAAIVGTLSERVYVSFNINGLDPKLCPGTSRPVLGGLDFAEAACLLEQLVAAGKKIVGFDLCEVAPAENMDWDAQVGSRLLRKLVMTTAACQAKRS